MQLMQLSILDDMMRQDQNEKYFSPWLPKNYQQSVIVPKYQQVFEDKIGFVNNACIVDMLFCCGGKELKQLLS